MKSLKWYYFMYGYNLFFSVRIRWITVVHSFIIGVEEYDEQKDIIILSGVIAVAVNFLICTGGDAVVTDTMHVRYSLAFVLHHSSVSVLFAVDFQSISGRVIVLCWYLLAWGRVTCVWASLLRGSLWLISGTTLYARLLAVVVLFPPCHCSCWLVL